MYFICATLQLYNSICILHVQLNMCNCTFAPDPESTVVPSGELLGGQRSNSAGLGRSGWYMALV